MLEHTAGLYLVCILGKDHQRSVSKDHVGCVDANKGEILDCLGRYVMHCSLRSIQCCVGDGFFLDRIAGVRLIELKPMAPSTGRIQKPISTEKRNLQREKKGMTKRVEMTIE